MLSRKVVQAEDHKIIFERIVPPVVVAETGTAPAGAGGYTGPQLPRRALSLSCTVFDHEFSEVRWRDAAGGEYVIWSSIDFTPFTGRNAGGFVQDGVRYSLFMGLGEALESESAEPLSLFHSIAPPTGTASWYAIVKQPDSVPSAAFAGINALHLHYDANKASIIAEHEQVKTANAARLAWEAAHPPVKQDTVIRYWPIQSALHGTAPATATATTTEDAP